METLFMEQHSVSTSLVADVYQYVYKTTGVYRHVRYHQTLLPSCCEHNSYISESYSKRLEPPDGAFFRIKIWQILVSFEHDGDKVYVDETRGHRGTKSTWGALTQ